MNTIEEQIASSEARYAKYSATRDENLRQLDTGNDWRQLDSAERMANRFESRNGVRGIVTSTEADSPEPDPLDINLHERILNRSDLTDIAYFYRFTAASRAVARIRVHDSNGRVAWHGTGFLVSPQLLLTNNHVIPSFSDANKSTAQFDYYQRKDGSVTEPLSFELKPQLFFRTHKKLDFTLVGIAETNGEGHKTADFGFLNLIGQSGKAIVGERVNIIQHPSGRPKEIAFRDNQIIDVPDDFLHYKADTLPGSSGSPVLNEDGNLAALHHAGVPNRQGDNILLRDGSVWNGSRARIDEIDWIANEGVRISSIVAYLQSLRLSPDELRLLKASFEPPPPAEQVLDGFYLMGALDQPAPPTIASPISHPMFEADDSNSWWVRINVAPATKCKPSVTLIPPGETLPGANPTPPIPGSGGSSPDGGMPGWNPENYYKAEEDRQAREDYYASLDLSRSVGQLYHDLHELLSSTHSTRLSYKRARWDHLYPNVDRRESGNLRNVYSGNILDPAEILAEEKAMMEHRITQILASGQEFDMDDDEAFEALESMMEEESSHPFNCEHVVPQSWFGKKPVPKTDLHHLFTCEPGCNSFRGNYAYYDFDPLQEAMRSDCGRREGRAGNGSKFEPEFGRGAVARATLYFLIRYPNEIDGDHSEMPIARLDTLKRWHQAEPVSLYEHHRNAEIFKVQGCRNPLIDHPDWIDKIDFKRGFRG